MEDYKIKYEKAIEKAKKELQACGSLDCDAARQIFRFFPELKESEDERIRKEIIQFLQLPHPQFVNKRNHEEWISWLEKQGEQKPADKSDVLMSLDEAIAHCKEKSCGDNACALEHKQLEKWLIELKELKKQNPAWNEEDERMLGKAISTIRYALSIPVNKQDDPCFVGSSMISWLKSLKERYTWKPSDEQIEAFEHFVRSVGESGYALPYDNNTKLLYSLLQQLKKLREK